jgi:3-hydroxyisobutyrate dehydrogenase-like beta-hydroxyacid dehydrogenase
MLRSVMVKGMEALMAECFLAARRAGVEDKVLASLSGSFPEIDWPLRGAYNLERMIVHGRRRAAEMREVALTVEALGLPANMVHACVEWQEKIGQTGADSGEDVLETRLEAVLKTL